jgi:NadR type nicotinamide-nucleotide adenylyltransferase
LKTIVITGPESTGKTTLAKELSQKFNISFIEEYAVQYLTKTGGKYSYRDLLKIAKGQIEEENRVINNTNENLIILDTDLITIKIWSKVKFGKVSRWIMQTIRNRHYDHYLLCYPDIPWEYDLFRENPNDRNWLFDLYEKELKKYRKHYTVIKGSKKERLELASRVIESL